MSWLAPNRDGALGLLPEQRANLEELHASAWAMNDEQLLELCWQRMARALDCRFVDGGSASAASTPAGRAALAWTDQFVLDASSVTPELNEALLHELGSLRALYQFASGVSTAEVTLRACVLLDVDPRLPRGEPEAAPEPDDAPAPPPDDGLALRAYYKSAISRRFAQARVAYGKSVVRLAGVDALTTEAVRLRNATFQQCLY
jgi:hypothetical protein